VDMARKRKRPPRTLSPESRARVHDLHARGVARLSAYERARDFSDIFRDESVKAKRLKARIDNWVYPLDEPRGAWISPTPGARTTCGLCGTLLSSREEALEHQKKVHSLESESSGAQR
jgi:hypothetical protein